MSQFLPIEELKQWLRETVVHRLVAIMFFLFLLQMLLEAFGWYTGMTLEGFILTFFALQPIALWSAGQIWSVLSYGFLHYGFMHVLFNALMLYFSGHMLKTFWTDRQVVRLFLLGIVSGGIVFLGASTFGADWKPLVGASGGVLALIVAAARISPQMPVYLLGFLRVPLWGVAGLLVMLSLSGLQGENAGGNLAHLGGAAIGFILAKSPHLLSSAWIGRRPSDKGKTHLRIVKKEAHEFLLDDLLDKIAKVGYSQLSRREKEFLEGYGKK